MVFLCKSKTTTGTVLAAQNGISFRIRRVIMSGRNTAATAGEGITLTFTPADCATYKTSWSITAPLVPSAANTVVLDAKDLDIVTWANTAVSFGTLNGAIAAQAVYIEYEEIAGITQRLN